MVRYCKEHYTRAVAGQTAGDFEHCGALQSQSANANCTILYTSSWLVLVVLTETVNHI